MLACLDIKINMLQLNNTRIQRNLDSVFFVGKTQNSVPSI